MRSVLRKIELLEDLGRLPEVHRPTFLSNGERCEPNGNQTVLPVRDAMFGIASYLEAEFPVPACVAMRAIRRPTDWKATQDERTGVKREFLPTLFPTVSNQLDRFHPLLLLL